MLVIISEKIVNENNERLRAITRYGGAFKFKGIIKNTLTESTTKTTRWAVDITQDEALQVLADCPEISMRIDTITGSPFFICENFADKYWHFE